MNFLFQNADFAVAEPAPFTAFFLSFSAIISLLQHFHLGSALVYGQVSVKGTRTRTGLKFPGSGPNRAGPGPDTGAGPV